MPKNIHQITRQRIQSADFAQKQGLVKRISLMLKKSMGSVITMNNQNAKNTPKTYDAGDLWDIQSLAEFDMNWMEVAISDIKNRLKEIKAELGGKDVLGFYALENVIDMYQYIAEKRHSYHAEQAEKYKKEWHG